MRQQKILRAAGALLALTLAISPAAGAISVEEGRKLLEEYYIYDIPEEILNLPTIEEITAALGDPYTYYMDAEEYAALMSELSDTNVTGIGLMAEKTADGLLVVSVAGGGPAERAGMQVDDLVVAVNGTDIREAGSPDALAALIVGEVGTDVAITYLREGVSRTLTLTREEVVFPTVTGEIVDGRIGWLECTTFGDTTGDYVEEYITEEQEEAEYWVVDLRGNPGGSAEAVVEAVGYVLGSYDVAYVANKQGAVGVWKPNPMAMPAEGLIQEPLVVLVDSASASASELFASAMRDYHYGLIIGTRTFGKGVAQNILEQEDGSAFRITAQRYYSPNFVTPDRSGVLPHLVLDADLADEAARLLCGEAVAEPSPDVLVLELAGETWYIHREAAVSGELSPAFPQILSALAPNTPMTLDGRAVSPAEAAAAWGVTYSSRWFDDVDGSPYADQINTLAALGLLSGDENGDFHPSRELTRAELVMLITQTMGYWCWETEGKAPFGDVDPGDWYAAGVDITYNLGLIEGNGEGEFSPDALIDRQQFLSILSRMGALSDLSIQQRLGRVTEEELAQPEFQVFDPWARAAAVVGEELGLLHVPLDEFDPHAVTTREEAAAMLYNFLSYTGILTPVSRA